jgi:hypothetical protein
VLLHQDLAAHTTIVFVVLCVILLGMFILPRLLGQEETRLSSTYLPLAFLALYAVGILLLVNTAHAGGRLVHGPGVQTTVPTLEAASGGVVAPTNPSDTLPKDENAQTRSK